MNRKRGSSVLCIALLSLILIVIPTSGEQQTQTIKDYTITFSTIPEQPVVGVPAKILFEVWHIASGETIPGLRGVVHIYGPGIHRIFEAQETPDFAGRYQTDYTFPVDGIYNIALEATIGKDEVWAFFKLRFGEPPSTSGMIGRLVISLVVAGAAVLIVSKVPLSGGKKILLSLGIVFVALSFALAIEVQPTSPTMVVYVLDERGDPVSDALVTISGPHTANEVTDGGYCIFRDIPQGVYSIEASAKGHPSGSKEEVIESGQISYVFVFLSP